MAPATASSRPDPAITAGATSWYATALTIAPAPNAITSPVHFRPISPRNASTIPTSRLAVANAPQKIAVAIVPSQRCRGDDAPPVEGREDGGRAATIVGSGIVRRAMNDQTIGRTRPGNPPNG